MGSAPKSSCPGCLVPSCETPAPDPRECIPDILPNRSAKESSQYAHGDIRLPLEMKVAPPISRDEIKSQLDARRAFLLIDVLPAEFYEEVHLPGAKDACVYEINFL